MRNAVQAIKNSDCYVDDISEANVVYVYDYCYYIWWLAHIHSALGKKVQDTPGDHLIKVTQTQTSEKVYWHVSQLIYAFLIVGRFHSLLNLLLCISITLIARFHEAWWLCAKCCKWSISGGNINNVCVLNCSATDFAWLCGTFLPGMDWSSSASQMAIQQWQGFCLLWCTPWLCSGNVSPHFCRHVLQWVPSRHPHCGGKRTTQCLPGKNSQVSAS